MRLPSFLSHSSSRGPARAARSGAAAWGYPSPRSARVPTPRAWPSRGIPALLLSLAACGDSTSDPAKFASATDLQRQRAVVAGSGTEAAFAFLVGSFATSPDEGSSCPTLSTSGATTTATFNCTDDEGNRIDGRIVATNVGSILGGGLAPDPTRDAVLTFDGFHQHGATAEQALIFDGTITMRPDQKLVISMASTLGGLEAVTDATFLSSDGLTTASAGSSVEVEGLGSATISGTWFNGEEPAGTLVLEGADVLRAAYGDKVDGCVPLTVDGQAAGELCDQ